MLGKSSGSAPPSGVLTLEFDNIANAPVANPASVSDWNTLFQLPANGTPFSAVNVAGNVVELVNTGTITIPTSVFFPTNVDRTYLIRFIDTDIVAGINNNFLRRHTSLVECVLPIVTSIPQDSFVSCSSLATCLAPLATSIGNSAFSPCGLVVADFPSAIAVGSFAFANTNLLQSVDLPSCISLGTRAFLQNAGSGVLTSVSIPNLTTLTGDAHFFSRHGAFALDFPLLTSAIPANFCQSSRVTSFSAPQTTGIGNVAFNGCILLQSVDANQAQSIGSGAFQGCTQLSSVNCTAAQTIANNAFRDTPLVVSFDFPACTTIGDAAFFLSSSNFTTTTFNAPDCTTINGGNTFGNRRGLTTINLASCTHLGATTGNNLCFGSISGNTITFTLPVGTRTDGDAVALASANTVTFLP